MHASSVTKISKRTMWLSIWILYILYILDNQEIQENHVTLHMDLFAKIYMLVNQEIQENHVTIQMDISPKCTGFSTKRTMWLSTWIICQNVHVRQPRNATEPCDSSHGYLAKMYMLDTQDIQENHMILHMVIIPQFTC